MAAPNPKPNKCTIAVGSAVFTIYGKIPELSPYIGALTDDGIAEEVVTTQTVKVHTRRRYPGGPAKTVKVHTRRVVTGGRLTPPTLPGNNAWIEEKIGTGASAVRKVEQFTFVGNFSTLKEYCRANAVKPFKLRSPWGEPFTIEAAA